MIYRSVSKGLTITQQIMDYSKVGYEIAGKEPINLDRVFQNLATENASALMEAGISIQLDLNANELVIYGLESHFESVFKNLLFNARDALLDKTIQDERKKIVQIVSRGEEPNYLVEVTDNGVGISPENIPKIYDAFFSTKPDSGTGLGLGMVQKIITIYNGTIAVKSELEKGTVFTVTFPISNSP
jgi:signal transduction histidine kinase